MKINKSHKFLTEYSDFLTKKRVFDSITGQEENITLPMMIPHWMKVSDKKSLLYSQDPYFREGYNLFEYILGSQLYDFCKHHTYILIRPDAIVSRKVNLIISELEKMNYKLVYGKILKIDRHMSRAVWFYHLNAAPTERFSIIDFFFERKECLFVLLENISSNNASSELSSKKGSVNINRRNNQDLRSRISAKDNLLSFIHAPDEICDMIREIIIFFDAKVIKTILYHVHSMKPKNISQLTKSLYNKTKERDLNIEIIIQKLRDKIFSLPNHFIEKNLITEELSKLSKKGYKPYKKFLSQLFQLPLDLDHWDKIILLSHFSQEDLQDIKYLDQ
ncbi:MAG: nucleoside-diphosphate kinase [Janthinobacterium lividum]